MPDGPQMGADQLQQHLKNGKAKALIATQSQKGHELGKRSVWPFSIVALLALALGVAIFLFVDCLKVRSDCRRRGIGRQMAVEMIRIGGKSNDPLIGWIAKEDAATDAFFQSIF
ncbi:hypothetical protein niasHS_004800 [Heterodera schachtii]|uniref:N-acetyltransferase domain-containing protein n=1 Tax=Heterodera schachtii TaxID=97005 RepID=A0ABD2K0A3_HETSC